MLGLLLALSLPTRAIDPFEISLETFQSSEMRDGTHLTGDDGTQYRVDNTSYLKGLSVRKDGEWVPHGRRFLLSGDRLSEHITYRRGLRDGAYTRYTVSNGENVPDTKGQYHNGKKSGVWKRYDGKKLLQKIPYENGRIHGTLIEYRIHGEHAGTPAVEKEYRHGDLHGPTRRYSANTGNLILETVYEHNMKMEQTRYHERSGTILQEVDLRSDTPL